MNISLTVWTQRALANQPWKEYTAEGGRKYWYNTETKQSSWEMPSVYKDALSKVNAATSPAVLYAEPSTLSLSLLIRTELLRLSPGVFQLHNSTNPVRGNH